MTASVAETSLSEPDVPVPEGSHTPPPDYTEKDPAQTDSLRGSIRSSRPHPGQSLPREIVMATTPVIAPKVVRAKKPDGQNTDFVKGLIPMTMAGDDIDQGNHDATDAPYDIDKDSLLQDAPSDSRDKYIVGILQKIAIGGFFNHKTLVWRIITGIFLAGYTFYLGFAVAYSPYGAIAPLVFTGLGLLSFTYGLIKKHFGKEIYEGMMIPFQRWFHSKWHIFRWFVYPAPLFGVIIYLSIMMTEIRQLQSLSGFVFFFCVLWLTSKHPDKVVWRPVIWGYTLQFTMGLMVLQWEKGYIAVEWLSSYVTKIINFGFQGAAVIYGDPYMLLHPFLMMGLSLLIYVGAVLSILYFFGVTQILASKMAWALAAVLGTTAIETLGVTANIFLNGMDVMLMLRPYLMKLTMSEFNCFLVGNNSTIAGFMFGILVMFGAPPQHLLSAAVMSAPAAIAIAKLNYPETVPEKSITKNINDIRLSRGTERNMFEAAANGSAIAGKTVMTVVVNYISFMSILYFLDASLSWLGGRVGYTEVSFEWICSYLFFPIALLIGVEVNQCRQVAKVIGLKIFTTEVYSYQILGQIYDQGLIDDRSKALGTYALCGFSSLSTLAIAVGVWQVVCPQRRPLVTRLMFRVLFQANIACFTTACVAGLFYSEQLAIFDNEDSPLRRLVVWISGQSFSLFG